MCYATVHSRLTLRSGRFIGIQNGMYDSAELKHKMPFNSPSCSLFDGFWTNLGEHHCDLQKFTRTYRLMKIISLVSLTHLQVILIGVDCQKHCANLVDRRTVVKRRFEQHETDTVNKSSEVHLWLCSNVILRNRKAVRAFIRIALNCTVAKSKQNTSMPFMVGRSPIRRTLRHLQAGRLLLDSKVRVMTINYNIKGDHHEGLRYTHRRTLVTKVCDWMFLIFHCRDFVHWNLHQVQYKNPDVQVSTLRNLTPTPFIRFIYGKCVCARFGHMHNTTIIQYFRERSGNGGWLRQPVE